jgi:hypothetical protein
VGESDSSGVVVGAGVVGGGLTRLKRIGTTAGPVAATEEEERAAAGDGCGIGGCGVAGGSGGKASGAGRRAARAAALAVRAGLAALAALLGGLPHGSGVRQELMLRASVRARASAAVRPLRAGVSGTPAREHAAAVAPPPAATVLAARCSEAGSMDLFFAPTWLGREG